MSKHTKGPWVMEVVPGSYQRPALVISGTKVIASCFGDQLTPSATSIGEATANARLIAATPELLSALQRLCVRLAAEPTLSLGFATDLAFARAAIAKATGEAA